MLGGLGLFKIVYKTKFNHWGEQFFNVFYCLTEQLGVFKIFNSGEIKICV